jgi:DNA-directed RNA polymerase specialized sigma24 family protein
MCANSHPRGTAGTMTSSRPAPKNVTKRNTVAPRPATSPSSPLSDGAVLQATLGEVRASNHLLALLAVRDLEQRSAVLLLNAAGLSAARIASVVGVTTNAVHIALHRARKTAARTAERSPSDEDAGSYEA